MAQERQTLGVLLPEELQQANTLNTSRTATDESLRVAMAAHAMAVAGLISAHNTFWNQVRARMPGIPAALNVDYATGELFVMIEMPDGQPMQQTEQADPAPDAGAGSAPGTEGEGAPVAADDPPREAGAAEPGAEQPHPLIDPPAA